MEDRLKYGWIAGLAAAEAGENPAPELIAWAERALAAGVDTPTLRVLAGLLPAQSNSFEVLPYAHRAVAELGCARLERESLLRAYIPEVCRAMLSGELGPAEMLDRIHRRVVSPLGHPPDLMRWCYLWEGNGPECEYLPGGNADYVMKEARRAAAEPVAAAERSRS